jgi:hypothetical protein
MEAIHRKDSSEVPCQPKNPRDSFFKDLKVERMVLDRTQMDRVSRLREPFRVHQCSRQHFLSRDRQTRAGAVSAPLRFLWTVREPIHRNTVQDPLRPANSDPEASSRDWHTLIEFRRERPDWDVLLLDHHEGYLSWTEFERNQRLIADKEKCNVGELWEEKSGGKALFLMTRKRQSRVVRTDHSENWLGTPRRRLRRLGAPTMSAAGRFRGRNHERRASATHSPKSTSIDATRGSNDPAAIW